MKRLIIILSFLLVIIGLSVNVQAATSYTTRTINRYGELIETQAAYEAVIKIKSVDSADGKVSFSNPKDLFIDSDDYLYVLDSGNKRVVILDENNEYLTSFGEDKLNQPRGIYVRDERIYIADYGKIDDNASGRIFIYSYDKELNQVSFLEELPRPNSIVLQVENFIYRPEKIAVDSNLTMYVVVEGSYNGVLLIDKNNRFLNYFAPNQVKTTFKQKLTKFLYGDNEKVTLQKILPAPPFNVYLDDSGYIYTVTKSIIRNDLGDTLKKVNIGGVNFYPKEMWATGDFVAACSGDVGNVYAVSQTGFIYEYDIEGNLLFFFGGKSSGVDQLGLFNSAAAIARNSQGNLFVLDDNDGSYQIFNPTAFAHKVHAALGYYNNGQYVESKALWEEVLRYNSMFDLAHKGIGMAYFLENDFEAAMEKFELANAKTEYSDAFWEIRNVWLTNYFGYMVLVFSGIVLLIFGLRILNRKTAVFAGINAKTKEILQKKPIHDFLLLFRMARHPLDTTYILKTDKTISIRNGFIFLGMIFGIYLVGLSATGFLFNDVIIEDTILFREAVKIVVPIIAFVIANYLTSSLLEGEGRFKSVFLVSLAALAPIIILYPLLIIISNVLTYNERFIYDFGIVVMLGWAGVLVFITNKELHNYSIKRNILNFLLTILMMLVLIIVVILISLIIMQVFGFISDVIMEVIFRD
ncbi:MAG: hypothetical protein GX661_04950 [Acholeplasmataceae bacterium]|jgi:hypothetical protein|nr:hypothetical protein [Acholeplasmataceae bacterium]